MNNCSSFVLTPQYVWIKLISFSSLCNFFVSAMSGSYHFWIFKSKTFADTKKLALEWPKMKSILFTHTGDVRTKLDSHRHHKTICSLPLHDWLQSEVNPCWKVSHTVVTPLSLWFKWSMHLPSVALTLCLKCEKTKSQWNWWQVHWSFEP